MPATVAASSGKAKWATPLVAACTVAPPRASELTSSPVTALITCGPVMNMLAVLSVMKTKSVRAGE